MCECGEEKIFVLLPYGVTWFQKQNKNLPNDQVILVNLIKFYYY